MLMFSWGTYTKTKAHKHCPHPGREPGGSGLDWMDAIRIPSMRAREQNEKVDGGKQHPGHLKRFLEMLPQTNLNITFFIGNGLAR